MCVLLIDFKDLIMAYNVQVGTHLRFPTPPSIGDSSDVTVIMYRGTGKHALGAQRGVHVSFPLKKLDVSREDQRSRLMRRIVQFGGGIVSSALSFVHHCYDGSKHACITC